MHLFFLFSLFCYVKSSDPSQFTSPRYFCPVPDDDDAHTHTEGKCTYRREIRNMGRLLAYDVDYVIGFCDRATQQQSCNSIPTKDGASALSTTATKSATFDDLIDLENDVHISPASSCHCGSSDADEWFHGIYHQSIFGFNLSK